MQDRELRSRQGFLVNFGSLNNSLSFVKAAGAMLFKEVFGPLVVLIFSESFLDDLSFAFEADPIKSRHPVFLQPAVESD